MSGCVYFLWLIYFNGRKITLKNEKRVRFCKKFTKIQILGKMIWRKKRFLLEDKKWWDAVFATFPILVQYRGRIYVTLQSFPLPQYSTLKDFFLRIRRRTQQNQRYEGESKWKTQKYRKLGNFSLARIFFRSFNFKLRFRLKSKSCSSVCFLLMIWRPLPYYIRLSSRWLESTQTVSKIRTKNEISLCVFFFFETEK